MNKKEQRWKERFQNFEKTYRLLVKVSQIKKPSEAEIMGLMQAFELCFELSWKLMKDYLELVGHIVKSPREVIRQATQDEIVKDGHSWLDALDDRNEVTHVYDEKVAAKLENAIRDKYLIIFENLYDYFKQKAG